MPQRLWRENDRIEIKLLQIFARFFLDGLFALVGKHHAPMVHAIGIRRQEAASMGRANLQVGKPIQSSFENHVRKENGRFERIADYITQVAISPHSGAYTRGIGAVLM